MRVLLIVILCALVVVGCASTEQSGTQITLPTEGIKKGGNETGAEPPPELPQVAVEFSDSQLEQLIREVTNNPGGTIYLADLWSLKVLDASNRSIERLSGLEYCVNLRNVRLEGNPLVNISSLGNLPGSLIEVRLGDGTLLYSYTSLRLHLSDTGISNLSPLSSLTSPDELWLYLNYNQISDLSSLSSLTNLMALYLRDNQISDVSPLASLTNLEILDLSNNLITDASPLDALPETTKVMLEGNPCYDS